MNECREGKSLGVGAKVPVTVNWWYTVVKMKCCRHISWWYCMWCQFLYLLFFERMEMYSSSGLFIRWFFFTKAAPIRAWLTRVCLLMPVIYSFLKCTWRDCVACVFCCGWPSAVSRNATLYNSVVWRDCGWRKHAPWRPYAGVFSAC